MRHVVRIAIFSVNLHSTCFFCFEGVFTTCRRGSPDGTLLEQPFHLWLIFCAVVDVELATF